MYHQLEKIAQYIWLYPRHTSPESYQPNIGVIDVGTGTVLINAGSNLRDARRLLTDLFAPGLPPVDTMIYTQHHWTHTLGAMTLGAKTTIAHEKAYQSLENMTQTLKMLTKDIISEAKQTEKNAQTTPEVLSEGEDTNNMSNLNSEANITTSNAPKPSHQLLREEVKRTMEDGHSLQVVLPNMLMQTSFSYFMGDHHLLLEHVQGHPVPETIVVKLPRARVMFVGNALYDIPQGKSISSAETGLDASLVQSLISPDYDIYIASYHPPFTREALEAHLAQKA
jgi:hypothetical protein